MPKTRFGPAEADVRRSIELAPAFNESNSGDACCGSNAIEPDTPVHTSLGAVEGIT